MLLPVGYSWSVVRMRRPAKLDCITPLNLFSVRSVSNLAGFKSIVVLYRNIGRLLTLMRIDQIIARKRLCSQTKSGGCCKADNDSVWMPLDQWHWDE